jgi:hypothetical protein
LSSLAACSPASFRSSFLPSFHNSRKSARTRKVGDGVTRKGKRQQFPMGQNETHNQVWRPWLGPQINRNDWHGLTTAQKLWNYHKASSNRQEKWRVHWLRTTLSPYVYRPEENIKDTLSS